jgi:DNA-binding transcriptional LysR family regulator
MVTEPYDVAIRMGERQDSNLIARQLARLTTYLYASSHYLEISGEPSEPAELEHHECLTLLESEWTLDKDAQQSKVSVGSKFVINSVGMIRRLAILDMWIILLPEEIVEEDLSSGRLRRVLPEWQGAPVPVYAITETRLLPAKTRCFIEFLRDHFREIK